MYKKVLGGVVSVVVLFAVAALAIAVFSPAVFSLGTDSMPVAADASATETPIQQDVAVTEAPGSVKTLKDWQYTAAPRPGR